MVRAKCAGWEGARQVQAPGRATIVSGYLETHLLIAFEIQGGRLFNDESRTNWDCYLFLTASVLCASSCTGWLIDSAMVLKPTSLGRTQFLIPPFRRSCFQMEACLDLLCHLPRVCLLGFDEG